ncbi:hypothetical protein SAMN05421780_101126 [Flexibacter flexilis DSM 6793]|uniref:HEPN AbiU2-like domain-containing protein n=1 Tax=Flexibacter flexilis DSM 6793 TaxID=927664 RepID=A0A1I1DCM1_9BACT|nr:hypothetical protein [Flexibacter flexilis]SFB72661.1 hypothetical protein SAMN05421780_101126 [Flexibacter flexilis DSM 6793]
MTEKIISLHKYWIYADKMRLLFRNAVKENAEEIQKESHNEIEAFVKTHLMLLGEFGIFKSFWYSSLYTVIEGYQDLKLSIPEIDELLDAENIGKLKLFRNGTYHFQKEIYNHKLLAVDQSDEFVEWIYKIHKELGNHIIKAGMSQFSEDAQKSIKNNMNSIFGVDLSNLLE